MGNLDAMLRLVFLLVAVAAMAIASPALETTFIGGMVQPLAAPSCHYDDPFQKSGCKAGEVNITVQGIQGSFCSPKCSATGECPTDVCPGTVAKPTCVLQDTSGNKYCGLVCDPNGKGTICSSDEHISAKLSRALACAPTTPKQK